MFKYFLNISPKQDGAIYLSSTLGAMLPEGTQELDPASTFTLKPGQLAIVATYSSVQIKAITDQLVISWDILPPTELIGTLQRFMDGLEVRHSLEEILHKLQQHNLHNDQRWFAPVKATAERYASNVQQILPAYNPEIAVSGGCEHCGRQFYLYSCHCKECKRYYCIWCKIWEGHGHSMYFVNNYKEK